MGDLKAVILAGGKGTRLAPFTTVLPKPLMPVGDEPIMEVVVRQLAYAGIRRITIAVGHLASLIMAYFGDGSRLGVSIDYSVEDTPLGTAGPLRLVTDLTSPFLVVNGDILADLDFPSFLRRHQEGGALATVGVTSRTSQIDFGVIDMDERGRLSGYTEKPVHRYSVSMGTYLFDPEVLRFVPQERFDLPELISTMLLQGQPVTVYQHEGYWLDIGRHDDYEQAIRDYPKLRDGLFSR